MRYILLAIILAVHIQACSTTTSVEDNYSCSGFDDCVQSITQRVSENSEWICDKKSNNKLVKVLTNMDRKGNIIDIKLMASSGDSEFDEQSKIAVQNSAPFLELATFTESEYEKASEIIFTFVGNKPTE